MAIQLLVDLSRWRIHVLATKCSVRSALVRQGAICHTQPAKIRPGELTVLVNLTHVQVDNKVPDFDPTIVGQLVLDLAPIGPQTAPSSAAEQQGGQDHGS